MRKKTNRPTYRKYGWVGNQISDEDMGILYKIKEKTKKPITEMVAEAVSRYVIKNKGKVNL